MLAEIEQQVFASRGITRDPAPAAQAEVPAADAGNGASKSAVDSTDKRSQRARPRA
jgi:hypothetical protein